MALVGAPPEQCALRRYDAVQDILARPEPPSITKIAFQLGYSSSAYFAAVFRRYVGMTPQQFRNSMHGEHAKSANEDTEPLMA